MSISSRLMKSTPHQRDYCVTFYDDIIYTTVTHVPSIVAQWISLIYRIHHFRLHKLIVGLDIEWRPCFVPNTRSRVATLQLCVGRRCLIFQLIHARGIIPQALVDFLNDPDFRFVGVGIHGDVSKLYRDYNLNVENPVNLQEIAAEVYECDAYYNIGLKGLTSVVLETEIQKPRNITLSDWSVFALSQPQIVYACLDAFLFLNWKDLDVLGGSEMCFLDS